MDENNKQNKPTEEKKEGKGFSLPPTTSKPPMPSVKPPKKK